MLCLLSIHYSLKFFILQFYWLQAYIYEKLTLTTCTSVLIMAHRKRLCSCEASHKAGSSWSNVAKNGFIWLPSNSMSSDMTLSTFIYKNEVGNKKQLIVKIYLRSDPCCDFVSRLNQFLMKLQAVNDDKQLAQPSMGPETYLNAT